MQITDFIYISYILFNFKFKDDKLCPESTQHYRLSLKTQKEDFAGLTGQVVP